jgi:pimeloyl-ACP methyl ester carboxylesterase
MPTTRFVPATDVDLCVREHSPAGDDLPTVVLVHGYPDRQEMWEPAVASLPLDDLHVVTYDVRGAGASGVPADRDGYRTDRLVDDLVAVLDATLPAGGRAHLVGHDWGSVQLWDVAAAEVTDPRLHGRIASFTSISGPSLDHAAWHSRHPEGRRGALLRQAAHSWYVGFFQTPVLPELLWHGATPLLRRLARWTEGTDHFGPGLSHDARNGVNLYRANVPRRMARTRAVQVDVPVLVIHPRRDSFVTGVLSEELDRFCADVRVVEVDAGHWFPRTHPDQLAELVLDQVRATETHPASRRGPQT